jgi:hypothetical protein
MFCRNIFSLSQNKSFCKDKKSPICIGKKLIISIFANMNWHIMEKKTAFLQMTFWVGDDETAKYYLIIVEIVDDIPRRAFLSNFPTSAWQFTRYPYGSN